eukprot:TRINITY_DN7243_c0_g1_i2.p1 TRINITY_DN7243_c0_g1~~TRINITY_DN7243_c0_g1_i2.p1  ORF type:complete len:740 (-),score=171.73 TRINITY_DN7243_c0_g1_i2:144-2165(-)
MQKLPAITGAEADTDACVGFIGAFATLSSALMALAGDLECSVTEPLQKAIAILTEESTGRAKHLQQVRGRFAALQERYRKTRAKTAEAKGRLASSGEGSGRWSWRQLPGLPSKDGKAASAQHAAVIDLARCEEELLESEASLRKLEDDSRQRLQQLGDERKAMLTGVLVKGTSSLRRLLPVADKVQRLEDFQGVMPSSTDGATSASSEAKECAKPNTVAGDLKIGQSGADELGADLDDLQTTDLAEEAVNEASIGNQKVLDSFSSGADRSFAYLQSSTPGNAVESEEEDEEEKEVEANARATDWSPSAASSSRRSSTSSLSRQRSLVFQSMGDSLITQTSLRTNSSSSSQASIKPPAGKGSPSLAKTTQHHTSPLTEASTPVAATTSATPTSSSTKKATLFDSEDESDEGPSSGGRKVVVPLDAPTLALQLSPVVSENPQRAFERYVQRVPEQLAATVVVSWDKLEASAKPPPTGEVGKMEMFWIHSPGATPTPETAEGLACFQFVQGCAAHNARLLHISVTAQDVPGNSGWRHVLPSAILETKRLVFATLPINSVRAIVLAGEDDTGSIHVDRDVEESYARCRFRWFQLTQSVRRSRSGLTRKRKVKLDSRFMVLEAYRHESDPAAPRNTVDTKPPMLLKSLSSSEQEALVTEALEAAGEPDTVKDVSFSSF